jgi:DNA-binding response OmpR family regulator
MMGKLVLIVDDSTTVCTIFERCLEHAGYEVKCCLDGILAIRWLGSRGVHIPDLILVDLNLPKLDGYGVIQHLRAQPAFAQTTFVIITRRNSFLDKLKGQLVGATAYLVKPVEATELLSVVQSYLGVVVPVDM